MIDQVGSAKADLDVADPEFRDDRRDCRFAPTRALE
jgi:hypothetical protein